jgi:ParB-like chromosome segregation protein Spo0J
MELSKLIVHPDNNRIYTPQDLGDLEQSLESNGLLEPIAITKDNKVISGHRRLAAMKNLGWTECEIRFIEPENELISLIEFNKHRIKTASDILNEARFLEVELKKVVGRGRSAAKKRQGKRIKVVEEVASRLGLGTTRLKQLQSISNYEPDLVKLIDENKLSVGGAYEQVRQKHLLPKSKKRKKDSDIDTDNFDSNFKKILKTEKPSLSRVNKVLRETYPYCLELTNIDEDRRAQLIDHLELVKKLDSRQLMMRQKFDELEHRETSSKDLKDAKALLPSYQEIEDWWQ